MKTFGKYLLVVLAVIVIGSMLVIGCAKPQPAPAPSPSPSPAPSPAPAPAPAPSPTPAPPPAQAEVFKWTFCHALYPANFMYKVSSEWFVPAVKERSGGRLILDIHPGGDVVDALDYVDALGTNAIQLAWGAGPYYEGKIPEAGLEMGLPLSWSDIATYNYFLYNLDWLDILRTGYGKFGVYYLQPQGWPGEVGISTVKEVHTLADLKGQKVRAWGTWATLAQQLGMAPVVLPAAEEAMAMKTGTLDATFGGVSMLRPEGALDMIKTVVNPPFLVEGPCNMLVSQQAWNKLPDDLKMILEFTAMENGLRGDAAGRAALDLDKAEARRLGAKYIMLPDEDVQTLYGLAIGIWDNVAKTSPACAQAIQQLKDYYTERGMIK